MRVSIIVKTMDVNQKRHLYLGLENWIYSLNLPKSYQEPDYIAKLVTELPSIIKEILKDFGLNVQVGGGFIHQKPLAHFTKLTGYKDPELGDLLIVCREKRSFGYVYNSILFQAKMIKDNHIIHIPRDHQFILYSILNVQPCIYDYDNIENEKYEIKQTFNQGFCNCKSIHFNHNFCIGIYEHWFILSL